MIGSALQRPGGRDGSRRGVVLVAVVVIFVLFNLAIVGAVMSSGVEIFVGIDRLDTVRSFYAAEGGVNMGLREMMVSADEDGDGGVGSISDDGDPRTDPAIGDASAFVTTAVVGPVTQLISEGASGAASRRLTADLEY
ncbi:MAG: hypothetical protein ACF8PN_14460 [Phycisphaerales bacterium]